MKADRTYPFPPWPSTALSLISAISDAANDGSAALKITDPTIAALAGPTT